MARAEKQEVLTNYTLHLSEAEARALYSVVELIGGDRVHSSRRHTDSIYAALESTGIKYGPKAEGAIGFNGNE